MAEEKRSWTRQSEAFWRAHHEAWKRSDLNQRQYCETQGIPLKAFGNWRAKFKAEPQPPERKLLYRRRGLSHPLSPPFSHPLIRVARWPAGQLANEKGRPFGAARVVVVVVTDQAAGCSARQFLGGPTLL